MDGSSHDALRRVAEREAPHVHKALAFRVDAHRELRKLQINRRLLQGARLRATWSENATDRVLANYVGDLLHVRGEGFT